MDNSTLVKNKVHWKKHPGNNHFYYYEEYYRIFLLRMNDFPAEPLYTIINGLEITDIDDLPVDWTVER